MIKFPLHKRVMLVTEIGNIICEIKYAGKDTLKLKDSIKEMYTEDGEYYFSEMKKELIIDRNKVIGYSNMHPLPKNKNSKFTGEKVTNIADYIKKNN